MKKFRNIYIRGLLVLSVLGIASCSIDEYNPSGGDPNEIWATPEGFQTVVNSAYTELRYWYGKEDGTMLSEAGTDIWFNKGYGSPYSLYNNLSSGSSYLGAVWQKLYFSVNICNAGLERIEKAGFTDETEKKKKEGELRFLRALYYWHIVETWGNVVLRTKETKEAELTAQRSSVEEFYNVILSDLEIATQYLPDSWGDEYGRATRKAAYGFLARAYLSRASYGNENEYLAKARDAANTVISQQGAMGVKLATNYSDLWTSTANNKAAGKNGGEALFVVVNSTTTSLNYDNNANRLSVWFQNNYKTLPGLATQTMEYGYSGGILFPTLSFLDMFNETIDSRYNATFQELWKASGAYSWSLKDTAAFVADRKSAAIYASGKINIGDTAALITKRPITNRENKKYIVYDRTTAYNASGVANPDVNHFISIKKFRDFTRTAVTAQPGFNDVLVMRLAEMYMIAAEAEFRLGNSSKAAEHINVLRTRAAIKTPVDQTAAMQVDASNMSIDFILDENAREFAGEYKRWFDLKRTKKLADRVKRLNPNIPVELDDHYLVRPIPLSQMNALTNRDEFGQNPQYK